MIEGKTDIGNESLGLHQTASDGIYAKILFISYGMKCPSQGKGLPRFIELLNNVNFRCLDLSSLHYISLN